MKRSTSALLLVVLSTFATADARALEYAFTNIADTNTAAPIGAFIQFSHPVVSGRTVAFDAVGTDGDGIFTGNGGPLATIVTTSYTPPIGALFAPGFPAIDGTTVTFGGRYHSPAGRHFD